MPLCQESGSEGNAREGANDDGPERGGVCHQGLLHGVIGFNGGRNNGGGA